MNGTFTYDILKMWRSWRKVLKKQKDYHPSTTHLHDVDQQKNSASV